MNLIFDIGYNTGGVSLYWHKNFWPGVQIIGVEPNIEAINLPHSYHDSKVTIVNHCISDVDNVIHPFYISHLHPISTCSTDWMNGRFKGSWQREIQIKSVTIDTLIKKFGKPEYIKIDVEGFELKALQGLTQKTDYISFEWTEEGKYTILYPSLDRLRELGYTQFFITLADDILNPEKLDYVSWEQFENELNQLDLNPHNQRQWGMVYAK